jgi:hypothetical protein
VSVLVAQAGDETRFKCSAALKGGIFDVMSSEAQKED